MKRTAWLFPVLPVACVAWAGLVACADEPAPVAPTPTVASAPPPPTTPVPTTALPPVTPTRPAADPPPTAKPVSAEETVQVVQSLKKQMRACYDDGRKGDPKMEGKMSLVVKVEPDGSVKDVTTSGEGLTPAIHACVAALFKSAHFAPPGGTGTSVGVPIAFKPDKIE